MAFLKLLMPKRIIAVMSAIAVLSVATLTMPQASSAVTPPSPIEIHVSQVKDLTDRQIIKISITPAPGVQATSLAGLKAATCADSVSTLNQANDQHVCPTNYPFSSNGDSLPHLYERTDHSELFGYARIGVGTASYERADGNIDVTCDPSHQCRLAVYGVLFTSAGVVPVFDNSTVLTFQTPQSLPGCTGFDADGISIFGPDRFSQAWAQWTAAQCAKSQSHVSPSRTSLVDEGAAVSSFASGEADVALSGTSYRSDGGFNPQAKRPMVPTPLALNAVVLAVGGGHNAILDPTWPRALLQPYEHVSVSDAEFSALLSWNVEAVLGAYGSDLQARNPEFNRPIQWAPGNSKPLATSGTDVSTLFATQFAKTRAGENWRLPTGDTPRSVTDTFATATPTFDGYLNLFTGRSALQKFQYNSLFVTADMGYTGVYWVLTDLATAKQLGLTVVSLQNASGKYVEPTPASLAAAVPSMKHNADGTLEPDPNAKANPDAYPLTYVEYALSPKEPLRTADGKLRTHAQAQLKDWLTYTTGPGQQNLANGFVPLPETLADQAHASIAQVGAGVSTEPPVVKSPSASAAPQASIDAMTPLGNAYGNSFGGSQSGYGVGPGSALAPDKTRSNGAIAPSTKSREKALRTATEATISFPKFAGARLPMVALAPLSLAGILGLMFFGASLTARTVFREDDARVEGND